MTPTSYMLDQIETLAAEVRRLREVEAAAAELLKFVDEACVYAWVGPAGECPDDKLRKLLKPTSDEAEPQAKQNNESKGT